MNENERKEKPEVYALRQDGGSWKISRRDFLKAAGVGAAAVGAGLGSGSFRPVSADDKELETICASSPAHAEDILGICASADGRHLISWSRASTRTRFKCWDFENYSLVGSHSIGYYTGLTVGGFIKKKSAVTYYVDSHRERISYLDLPGLSAGTIRTVKLNGNKSRLTAITVAKNGDIIAAAEEQKIIIVRAKENAGKYEKAVTLETEVQISKCVAFDSGKKLFVQLDSGECCVVSTEDGSRMYAFPPAAGFAVVPGEAAVLIVGEEPAGSGSHLYLYSLIDGHLIWDIPSQNMYCNCAVTPDGSMAILLRDLSVELRSIADGSLINENNFINQFNFDGDIAVAGNGTKFAVNYSKAILFISLPDLKLIGCPLDIKEMKDNKSGVEVTGKDVLTGEEVHYTLPCGAAIPDGAVCTCNCVAGRGGCAVNCSCNSHRSSGYSSSTYYYPN